MDKNDIKILLSCLGISFTAYLTFLQLKKWCFSAKDDQFVPIGVVKTLFIYPAKSCKGKKVFSFYCGPKGPQLGEVKDRYFQLIDGNTGVFWTARQKPSMVLIDVKVEEGNVTVTLPNGGKSSVEIDEIKKRKDVRQTTLHSKLRADGYDCGDAISALISKYLDDTDVRMVMYDDSLFTERVCRSDKRWWNNNEVPSREDHVAYQDLAPYMIQTEGSLTELNAKLERNVTQLNFRPSIVIDKCPAWDEDRWLELRIGEVELQCFKPCTRCILTTVDPETGVKDPEMQPLKKLREFRLAPEGPMRDSLKDSPIFGVNAGLVKSGFIHEGQVVYARYKSSVF